MIVYKIFSVDQDSFVGQNQDFFLNLLDKVVQENYLSPTTDEIIITDDIKVEIERYTVNRFRTPTMTRSREFSAIAKTVDFNGRKKSFLMPFMSTNSPKTLPRFLWSSYWKFMPKILLRKNTRIHSNIISRPLCARY